MQRRGSVLIFVTVSVVMAVRFWRGADWWYYVADAAGPIPKFEAPAWEQGLVSGIVGGFWGGLAATAWVCGRSLFRFRNSGARA